jgi:multicomponent Na+:H+ antiporter subunit D
MMAPWLPLVVCAPLVAGALTPALARGRPGLARGWALAVTAFCTFAAALLTRRVALEGPFSYAMGGWAAPWGIELRFDEFSAAALFICVIMLLVLVYSGPYVHRAVPAARIASYYSLLLISLGGMIGFVVTGDLFNLFVFMELVGVSSYALVAVAGGRTAALAAFKYLVAGAVSSVLILFCIGVLHALTGSLNMADVALRLAAVESRPPVLLALAGLTAGFLVKAGLFPVHVWLPDAHAIAPSPINAVSSALVVKLGIIGLLRIFPLFAAAGVVSLAPLYEALAWLGAISVLAGAFFALFQEDVKLMLAYSTISNIGYIVLGLGLAGELGVTGAGIHVLNHALIKATLFLAAGAMIHQSGYRTLHDLRGIGHAMPWTTLALLIGALSIVGLPPTAGFLGKWYIALGALEAGRPGFAVVVLSGALLIFAYFTRMLNAFYFRLPSHEKMLAVREAPAAMLGPVLVLAALCVLGGLLGRWPVALITPAVARLVSGG